SFPRGIASTESEHKAYKRFLAGNAKQGVYNYLSFKEGSAVSPFLEPDHLALDDHKRATILNTEHKPNERFGIALTALNKKRIFRQLKSSPHYETKKKDVLYELLDCGGSQVDRQRLAKIKKALKSENKQRIERMKIHDKDKSHEFVQMQELKMAKALAQLDWVSETLAVSRSEWSMAMEKDSLSFFDGILSGRYEGRDFYLKEDFIFEILQDLASSEPSYTPYFQIGYSLDKYQLPFVDKIDWKSAVQSCDQLKREKIQRIFAGRKSKK
ncbi:MAG: hypothetical protein AAF202_11215, partial [Pseudomonadota bacterium]